MDFAFLTSDRPGLPLLQKIGQQLLTHLDTAVSANNNAIINPLHHHPDTPSGGICYPPSSSGGYRQEVPAVHRQEEHQYQHQEHTPPEDPFPLALLPEDVRPSAFSFLSARELASVRRVSSDFLHTVNRHADALWGNLCRYDFPSMEPTATTTTAGARDRARLSPHQVSVFCVGGRGGFRLIYCYCCTAVTLSYRLYLDVSLFFVVSRLSTLDPQKECN